MAESNVTYTYDSGSNPSKHFTVPFGYLQESDLNVYVNLVLADTADWNLYNSTTVEFTGTLIDADSVKILRVTDLTTRSVDWGGSGVITEADLDNSDKQWFYALQEIIEGRVTI